MVLLATVRVEPVGCYLVLLPLDTCFVKCLLIVPRSVRSCGVHPLLVISGSPWGFRYSTRPLVRMSWMLIPRQWYVVPRRVVV